MENSGINLHWHIIKVIGGSPRETVEFLKWDGMLFEQHCKWRWYFRYRAALLQIKYPRYEISEAWGHDTMTKEQYITKRYKDALKAKKAQITKWENKLATYVSSWNKLFPVEDQPEYINAVKKIETAKLELQQFINEYDV